MRTKKGAVIIAAITLLVNTAYASDRAVPVDLSTRTPVNAAVRSFLLPGWGQFFNYQSTKGYIIAGGFAASALAAFLFYRQANDTYDDYKARGLRDGPLYDDYQAQYDRATVASYLAAGIWLYGIADAYLVGRGMSAGAVPDEGLSLHAPDGETVNLTYRKRF